VVAQDPEGAALTYTWQMTGEACGSPPVPWTQQGQSVQWRHNNDDDMCSHDAPTHPVTLTLTVSDSAGPALRCTMSGTHSQVIDNPACTPLR
jgi:hypothetical protein